MSLLDASNLNFAIEFRSMYQKLKVLMYSHLDFHVLEESCRQQIDKETNTTQVRNETEINVELLKGNE